MSWGFFQALTFLTAVHLEVTSKAGTCMADLNLRACTAPKLMNLTEVKQIL